MRDQLLVRVTDRWGRWAERATHVEIVAPPSAVMRWSDLSTWVPVFGVARFPTRADRVEFPATALPLVLDADDAEIGTLICHGTVLSAEARPVRLRVYGNFVVHHGEVILTSAAPIHLDMVDVDESRFIGGHTHDAVETDRGFWFVAPRRVELRGEPTTPWALLARAHRQGEHWLDLDRDVDVRVGCDVVIAPTLPVTSRPDIGGQQLWQRAYSTATVAAASGRRVQLSAGLQYDHPMLGPFADGTVEGAEVLFLSRSLRLAGTPSGRTHVIIMPHGHHPGEGTPAPVAIMMSDVETRWTGPQQPDSSGRPLGVLGRYSVHLHFLGDGSRGALLRRGVARDAGNHGVVTHASHGVTVEDHICHEFFRGVPYTWDRSSQNPPYYALNMSEDILYRRCIASRVRNVPGADSRLAGFDLVRGRRLRMEDCRAFGVLGGTLSAGLHWTEGESDDQTGTGVWDVVGFRAHNCVNGTSNWQNTQNLHRVLQRSRIANSFKGINHGAYANNYHHLGVEIVGCWWPLVWTAQAWHPVTLEDADIDVSGAASGFIVDHHVFPPSRPVVLRRCRFRGTFAGGSPVGRWSGASPARAMPPRPVLFFLDYPAGRAEYTVVRLEDCVIPAPLWADLAWFPDNAHPQNRLEVFDAERGAWITLRRADQPGMYDARWNAAVTVEE